jgi:hypothetical protein
MAETVFVATYGHKYGEDVWVYRSAERAELKRQSLANEWWDKELESLPKPTDPVELADTYFTVMFERMNEFFDVAEHTIID